jgi:hypothetical protein
VVVAVVVAVVVSCANAGIENVRRRRGAAKWASCFMPR